ncbi:hypothetical protein EB796_010825 [Bugula neritina]|uniref:Uncharacterized protein n=1 Tax=Bugula neritina TaxID=10212 RepID=A0A7J7JWV3_BUGNE|nr:hypothetical protein EB796_010825 [Bugula neritina]
MTAILLLHIKCRSPGSIGLTVSCRQSSSHSVKLKFNPECTRDPSKRRRGGFMILGKLVLFGCVISTTLSHLDYI